jgi:hypothetical protein
MLRAARAVAPKTRKGRTVAAVQPSTDLVISSNVGEDSSNLLRLQFLRSRAGLIGARASLVAQLAWGEAA